MTKPPPAKKKPSRVEDHLVAGTIAGLTSTAILFPLDLLKTHYQVRYFLDMDNKPYLVVDPLVLII